MTTFHRLATGSVQPAAHAAVMQEQAHQHTVTRPIARPRLLDRAQGWGLLRPYLTTVAAVSAVLALMSSADLDSPVPYLCFAAVVVASTAAELVH